MSNTYLSALEPQAVPVETHEGGSAYQVDVWQRLRRFLILGSESGSFYANARELTLENASVVQQALDTDAGHALAIIHEVSDKGLAIKNEPAIFALAIAASHSDLVTRKMALLRLPIVCRTGTHLLHFMAYCKKMRKSSRMYRTAIGNWFNEKDAGKLAYQAVKYKQRDGWSLADVLRIARPTPVDAQHSAIYKYIVDGDLEEGVPDLIRMSAMLPLLSVIPSFDPSVNEEAVAAQIREYRIPREAVPTEMLNSRIVWDALLQDMPLTAMIRNLGKMTSIGLLTNDANNAAALQVTMVLTDMAKLRGARVHPVTILNALKVYESGHGVKGSLSWKPVKRIVNALDEAFYLAFGTVEPTGKRIMCALDVSTSMCSPHIAGTQLTPREASAALALVTAATEPNVMFTAYSHKLVGINITPSMRMDEIIRAIDRMDFGGTLCSLPIMWAGLHHESFDAFISYTDSETMDRNYQSTLRAYRMAYGPARSIVVGMTANQFSLNDPYDALGMDVVGFSLDVPQVMSQFIAGSV